MSLPEGPYRLERRPDTTMLPRLRVADKRDRTVCLIPFDDQRLSKDEALSVGKAVARLPFMLFAVENLLADVQEHRDVMPQDLIECADMLREEVELVRRGGEITAADRQWHDN